MEGAARKVRLPVRGYPAAVSLYPSPHVSAPTILALHGFTGSGDDFLPLRSAMGPEQAHWICPDFMGHGSSASPGVIDPYLLPAALGLIDQARQLAPDPDMVVLIAYSMGARIALHYLRHSKPLPAVLIGASPGLAEAAERVERRDLDRQWIRILKAGTGQPSPMESFCQAWEAQALIQPQTRLSEPLRSQLADRRRDNDPTGLTHSLIACGTGVLPDLWQALPSLPPVTLVHGEWDVKFAAIARSMASLNPGFRIREIPASGHAPHLESPAEVLSVAGIPLYP